MSLDALLSETHVPERETLTRSDAHKLDRLLSRMAAVQRYRLVRKYARGVVVDAACGCGYGSWLLSKCPAVESVVGLDRDAASVMYAREHYPEASFLCADFCSVPFADALRGFAPDTVVSLETIEHLPDARSFIAAVTGSGASRWVVTFPSFETVTFNPYHLHDFTPEEVEALVGTAPAKTLLVDDAVHVMVFDL